MLQGLQGSQRGPRSRGREAAPGSRDAGQGSSRRAQGPGKAPHQSKMLKFYPGEFFRSGYSRIFSLGSTDGGCTYAVKMLPFTPKEIALIFRQNSLFFSLFKVQTDKSVGTLFSENLPFVPQEKSSLFQPLAKINLDIVNTMLPLLHSLLPQVQNSLQSAEPEVSWEVKKRFIQRHLHIAKVLADQLKKEGKEKKPASQNGPGDFKESEKGSEEEEEGNEVVPLDTPKKLPDNAGDGLGK